MQGFNQAELDANEQATGRLVLGFGFGFGSGFGFGFGFGLGLGLGLGAALKLVGSGRREVLAHNLQPQWPDARHVQVGWVEPRLGLGLRLG